MYLRESSLMCSLASSPSIVSTTRPRTSDQSQGLSLAWMRTVIPGSFSRFRLRCRCGSVFTSRHSPSVSTQVSCACGWPSGISVTTVARFLPLASRTVSSSSAIPSLLCFSQLVARGPLCSPHRLTPVSAGWPGLAWRRPQAGTMGHMTQTPHSPTVTLAEGVVMPLVGFGTWQLRGQRGYDAIRFALERGYRHIDTATMYGNEAEVGRALLDSRIDRRDVFLTTKLQSGGVGRERETITASLSALGTDYVDLWLWHRPPGNHARPQVGQGRRAGPLGGGEQLQHPPDRRADQCDRAGSRGQPDPVEPVQLRPPAAGRQQGARGRRGGLQPAQGDEPARSCPRRDRVRAPGDARPGRAALAHRARHSGDPEVGRPRPDRRQLRPVLVPAQPRGGGQDRRPVGPLTPAAGSGRVARAVLADHAHHVSAAVPGQRRGGKWPHGHAATWPAVVARRAGRWTPRKRTSS